MKQNLSRKSDNLSKKAYMQAHLLPNRGSTMSEMSHYGEMIAQIKENIRRSRYQAARSVNRELLLLYFRIGLILSERVEEEEWGAGVLERISGDIQKEFRRIRGFSVRNMKKMMQFYVTYSFLEPGLITRENYFQEENTGAVMVDSKTHEFVPSATAQFSANHYHTVIEVFLELGFTHHILILNRCSGINERFFYMKKAVEDQWSVNVLRHHLDSGLFRRKGKMVSNFGKTLPAGIKKHALEAFKDEYLLDFINVRDAGKESVVEDAVVKHIKDFMMSLGGEFTFISNQYRLIVGGDEFFIDLLFFHRRLQAMVAIELKTGKFRPEYAGKMNFYLTALDRLVKLPHENPSMGIVLCRSQNDVVVEFAFSDIRKPMGAATYRTGEELPEELKKYLPGAEDFKRLLEKEP